MSEFTKGPWLYRGKSDSVHERDSKYPYGSVIFQFHDEGSPSNADLALILSAPELLEALISAREILNRNLPTLDRNVGFCPNIVAATVSAISQADEAIAKALASNS